ncbi:MAG: type VI secretion system baseplate subunit TssE [Blastocatellia bacterium]|nr:type VI secretion system baseplate subunit TssE [Blastocatellia bacterium]
MSGIQGRERLQPSLIDRLTDNAPNRTKDGPDGMAFTQAQLRQAVLRDLAHLLNTSNLATIEDLSKTPLAAKSTLNYGIAGFAGLIEQSSRTTSIERELAEAIRNFEPRIRPDSLRVRTTEMRDDNALVFEIEGELWAQPMPQKLFLETTIDVETRIATVSELRQAR